jgi:hypothetical protein
MSACRSSCCYKGLRSNTIWAFSFEIKLDNDCAAPGGSFTIIVATFGVCYCWGERLIPETMVACALCYWNWTETFSPRSLFFPSLSSVLFHLSLLARINFLRFLPSLFLKITLLPTVSRSVRLGVEPIWGSWPDINYCLTVTVLSTSGAPSDERSDLSFVRSFSLLSIVIYISLYLIKL